MSNIGDSTGYLALFITLLWWFGVTPKNIAKWSKNHNIIGKIIFSIQLLIIILWILFAANHFIQDPYNLENNRWYYGSFWLLYSLIFYSLFADRYLKWKYYRTGYASAIRIVLLIAANILFTIGLSIPYERFFIWHGISVVLALILLIVIPLLRRSK